MDKLDLIAALADVTGVMRDARRTGIPAPLVCLAGHDPVRFSRWGHGFICCACGRRPMPADELHSAIVRMLRARVQIVEREAA